MKTESACRAHRIMSNSFLQHVPRSEFTEVVKQVGSYVRIHHSYLLISVFSSLLHRLRCSIPTLTSLGFLSVPLHNLLSLLTCPCPLAHLLQGEAQNPLLLHSAQLKIHRPRHAFALLPSLTLVEETYAFHSTLHRARVKNSTSYRLATKQMQTMGSAVVNMARLQTQECSRSHNIHWRQHRRLLRLTRRKVSFPEYPQTKL